MIYYDELDKRVTPVNFSDLCGSADKVYAVIDDNSCKFSSNLECYKKSFHDKKLKDSAVFNELIKSLLSKKSSYKTYFNSLVLPSKKSKEKPYIPSNINCIVKENRCDGVYGECVGSRLANLLGIDTVFNYPHIAPRTTIEKLPYYDFVYSVDFVEKGCRVVELSELGLEEQPDSSLATWINSIKEKLPLQAKKNKLKYSEKSLNKLIDDFTKMYLFRAMFCADWDFYPRNVLILVRENGEFSLAPTMDMEYIFTRKLNNHIYYNFIEENIKYLKTHNPIILDEFMKGINKYFNNGTIAKIVYNTMKVPVKQANEFMLLIHESVECLNLYYEYDFGVDPQITLGV